MKPKIPKLTKKERRMWIKALKEILYYYEEKDEIVGCPLCSASRISGNLCNVDNSCPWYWFTGDSCNAYSDKDFNETAWDLRKFRNPRWVKLRLRQIPRWIKKLEEGL